MSLRSEQEVCAAIDRHGDMVRRLCAAHLRQRADAEDVFQTVFLKFLRDGTAFAGAEHEKAWFIRVAVNACKDRLKSAARTGHAPLEEALTEAAPEPAPEHPEVLEAVRQLPQKYRAVVYLHYFEGYRAAEIGALLKKNTNTVYTLLARARAMLKRHLEGESDV